MNEELDKLVQEQAQKLPPELRKGIEAVPWKTLIREIAVSNSVPQEKLETVERETMLVIYGFDALGNYIDNLSREAGLTEDTAIAIAEAANQKIFSEISKKAEGVPAKEPVVPVKETKQEVIAKLSQRVEAAKQSGASVKPPLPKPVPEIHPMVKKGEVVHPASPQPSSETTAGTAEATQGQGEVPHVEEKTPISPPKSVEPPKPETTPPPPPLIKPIVPATIITSAPTESKAPVPETPKITPSSNSRYPGGLDPYREPLE